MRTSLKLKHIKYSEQCLTKKMSFGKPYSFVYCLIFFNCYLPLHFGRSLCYLLALLFSPSTMFKFLRIFLFLDLFFSAQQSCLDFLDAKIFLWVQNLSPVFKITLAKVSKFLSVLLITCFLGDQLSCFSCSLSLHGGQRTPPGSVF